MVDLDRKLSEPILFPLNAIFYLLNHTVVCCADCIYHLRLLLKELLFDIMMQNDGFLKVIQLKHKKRELQFVCKYFKFGNSPELLIYEFY